MTLVEAAPAVDGIKFNFLGTGALKAALSADDGKMRLHGVASSTMRDRHGDTMLESALNDMAATANEGMTVFLNHKYTIPEDIAGTVERATKSYDGKDALLNFDVVIDETNPRAIQTWKSVQAGRRVGISIGANLPEGGYVRNKDGTVTISHVDLLEASFVGVPANPKSWVEYAVKALHDADDDEPTWISLGAVCPSCGGGKSSPHDGCNSDYHTKAETPELEADEVVETVKESHSELPDSAFACIDDSGRHYPHHTKSGALDLNLLRNALARIADKSNTQCGKGHLEAHARKAGIGDRKSFEDFIALSDDALVEFAASLDADDHIHDPSDHIHDEVPVEETKAIVDIHIDTGNSEESGAGVASPEAQSSAPEAEAGLLDEDADGTNELLHDTVTLDAEPAVTAGVLSLQANDMATLIKAYSDVVKDLMEARTTNATLSADIVKANGERDAAIRERNRLVDETGALLTRLSEIPFIRKTSVAAAYTDFRRNYDGIYDEDFLDLLEKKRNDRARTGADRPQ